MFRAETLFATSILALLTVGIGLAVASVGASFSPAQVSAALVLVAQG